MLGNENKCSDLISKTVQIVQGCPQTQETWEEAAARKNCGGIPNSCTTIVYHCIMNTWQNETVDVCAPQRQIVGKWKKNLCKMNLNNLCYSNNNG